MRNGDQQAVKDCAYCSTKYLGDRLEHLRSSEHKLAWLVHNHIDTAGVVRDYIAGLMVVDIQDRYHIAAPTVYQILDYAQVPLRMGHHANVGDHTLARLRSRVRAKLRRVQQRYEAGYKRRHARANP